MQRQRQQQSGGRSFNRNAGGGRGPPRGRAPPPPDLSGISMVKTNIAEAEMYDSFKFYKYSVVLQDKQGKNIDDKSRQNFLFRTALFDTLLKERPKADRRSLGRLIHFQGSSFYSSSRIKELEENTVWPLQLLDGSNTHGDTFAIKQRFFFGKSKEFDEVFQESKGLSITMDCCCNTCAKTFADGPTLINHCHQTGHEPAYDMKDDTMQYPDRSVFEEYVNLVLNQALLETNLIKWGRDFIDPNVPSKEARDRDGRSLATVFQAYKCNFGIHRRKGPTTATLTLTVDLKSKVMRSRSVLDEIFAARAIGSHLSTDDQNYHKRRWIGQTVIYKCDYKTYTIQNLDFEHSAETLPVPGLMLDGRPCTHARYFSDRKNTRLVYPRATPMIEVLGRRNETIFLPAELVFGEELDVRVKEMLPQIASYKPEERNDAVDKIFSQLIIADDPNPASITEHLRPRGKYGEKAGGLLEACGITLCRNKDDASKAKVINAPCVHMSVPQLLARGIEVPKKFKQGWANCLSGAKYNTNANGPVTTLNAVVFYNDSLEKTKKGTTIEVYRKIKNFVNDLGAKFRLAENPQLREVKSDSSHSKS